MLNNTIESMKTEVRNFFILFDFCLIKKLF